MKLDKLDWLGVAGLLLTFALIAASPVGPKPFGDLDFHLDAKRLAAAAKGAGAVSDTQFSKAPGPILFYFPPYLTVPVNAADQTYWRAGVLWTAGWMVIALLLIRRTADRLVGGMAGKFAVAMVILSPFSVYYSLGIIADGPAYISMAFFVYGWVRCTDLKTSWWPPALMSAGLLFLLLCRPNAALVPMVGLVSAWRLSRRDGAAARKTAAVALASLLMFLAVGLLITSLQSKGRPSDQEGYFWLVAMQGRFQFRTEPLDWRFFNGPARKGSQDRADYEARKIANEHEALTRNVSVSQVTRAWIIGDTLAHPLVTAKMALVRVVYLHIFLVNSKPPSAFSIGPIPGALVYWTFHLALNAIGLSISILALVFLWQRRSDLAAIWPLWAPWLALVVFHALVYAEPRYLLPAKYSQVILAAGAMATWLRRAPGVVPKGG